MDAENEIENAVENYFYWKGVWRDDFKAIVSMAFQLNKQSSAYACGKACVCWQGKLTGKTAALFWFVWTLCIWAGSLVLLPTFTLILGVLTLGLLLYSNLVAFELNLVERLYLRIYRIQLLCPTCHRPPRNHVPIYECPHCHTVQHNLIPGVRYGAFYRVCLACGAHLPTSRLFGRHKLPAFCSHEDCRVAFDGKAESTAPNTIAFIGSPNVGKTTMLMDMVCQMTQQLLPSLNWQLDYPMPSDKQWAERLCSQMSSGARQQSTKGDVHALCIDANKGSGAIQRLYFYDPPGEVFGDTDSVSNQLYYRYLRIALLVVDPFSIPEIQDIRRDEFPEEDIQLGETSPDEGLSRWLISLERDFSSKGNSFACALIINKTDSPGLQRACNIHPGADEDVCLQFLERFGLGNMVENLRSSFKRFRVFAISARPAASREGEAIVPIGMEEVTSWTAEQLGLKK